MKVRQILKRILGIIFWFLLAFACMGFITFILGFMIERSLIFYVEFLVAVCFGFAVVLASDKIGKAFEERIRQAKPAELKREDDVLLQAVAFSQSVLFIYLGLIESSDIITLYKIIVPIFATLFYGLRAWGKIKGDVRYRYYSIFVFSVILFISWSWFLSYFLEPILSTEISFVLGMFSGATYLASWSIMSQIAKKRYGYP